MADLDLLFSFLELARLTENTLPHPATDRLLGPVVAQLKFP